LLDCICPEPVNAGRRRCFSLVSKHGEHLLRELMVYFDAEGSPEGRVRFSARLADRSGATLIGLSHRVPIAGFVASEVSEADIRRIEATLADKGEWFRRIAGADQRKLEWRQSSIFRRMPWPAKRAWPTFSSSGGARGPGDAYSPGRKRERQLYP
jgi:hypothetical protein